MHDKQFEEFDLDGVNVYKESGLEKGLKSDWTGVRDVADKLARAALSSYKVETARKSDEAMQEQVMADLGSPIEPDYYRKGKIDLFESWYLTRPFNEFRAIMESIAERYMKRIKNNRLEDLDKAGYVIKRLREYEVREMGK